MYKNIVGGNIYVRSKFYCVRTSHDPCARAHMHSLEGTLVTASWISDLGGPDPAHGPYLGDL